MKEFHKAPLDENELGSRIWQFPKALDEFNSVRGEIAKSKMGFYSKRTGRGRKDFAIIDNVVLKGMSGGIERMYEDLIYSDYKEFADSVLVEKRR